ncbi:myelin-oligodendrocyte glycoprotein-like isoform X3 [Fundulus heteroclitus]|uniref:myelin-oligodendrocyte glycoprotein-like isoform X3 n=1 Tax=Fundulus heteroclitus TaxID=8078 RepID=UPI00165B6124|nr:myelin-oligodendrocyte glycoprotein-like isoform X3 [Fundulus heteroclitus]
MSMYLHWITALFFSLSWTFVQGNLQLIGSSQPITAAPGDDVLLPCRVDPEWDAVGRTVEWSRPDLRVPGRQRRVEYVYVYRFQKTERDMMMETYVQRTSLSEAGLKRGDVSLTIRNVSLEDGGRFRCFIPSLRRDAEVLLVVDPNFVKMTTTEPVPDRNPTTPAPQEETISTGGRVRLHICFSVFAFFICLSAVLASIVGKRRKIQEVLHLAAPRLSRKSPDLQINT